MKQERTEIKFGKSDKFYVNGEEVKETSSLSLDGYKSEFDNRPMSFSFNFTMTDKASRDFRCGLAKDMARQIIKEFRDNLRDRRMYGLRVPRKMKKRAKRYEAEYIGKAYGVPTNKVLKFMKRKSN